MYTNRLFLGYDCANIEVVNNMCVYDEVMQYINARFVSATEAMWHLLKFPMHGRSHAVIRMAIHLPMEQQIRFMPVISISSPYSSSLKIIITNFVI
jgi:hypothetical protein